MTTTDPAYEDVTGDSSQHASSSDTTMLVENDITGTSGVYEEISMDMASLDTGPLIFSHDIPVLESPSECTTVSTISTLTAVPLDNKYRYHIFFAYHMSDASWVRWLVERLEDEPYCYKCCRWDRDMDDSGPRTQQILCSIMLSHRVVVVLSPQFVNESWSEYEESLAHLTSLTLRKRRLVPLILKACEVPEYLRIQHALEVDHADFFDSLLHAISLDGMTHSESVHTIRSLQSPHCPGFHNGQLLARLSASIEGQLKARLVFDHEEIPDTLISNDVSFTRQEFREVVRLVGRHDVGENLSWLFTSLPTIILSIIFCLWCIAFILVIVFFPDNLSSTLPVRLCVFSLPAILIVLGCVLRWRKVKILKEKYSICMFSRSIYVNKMFYERRKPVMLTTARTHDNTFHIYFLYFNISECVDHIKSTLSHCSDEDLVNLSKLIEMYTSHSGYLEGRSMAERLAVMMTSAYAIQWIFKRVQHTLEQRHTRHRQCVCQFVEEFLTAYLPCLRDQQTDLCDLSSTFLKYLNCQLKADDLILRNLGITPSISIA